FWRVPRPVSPARDRVPNLSSAIFVETLSRRDRDRRGDEEDALLARGPEPFEIAKDGTNHIGEGRSKRPPWKRSHRHIHAREKLEERDGTREDQEVAAFGKLRELACVLERLLDAAELVDEAELLRALSGPDAPLCDRRDGIDRELPSLRDSREEDVVDRSHVAVEHLLSVVGQPSRRIDRARAPAA